MQLCGFGLRDAGVDGGAPRSEAGRRAVSVLGRSVSGLVAALNAALNQEKDEKRQIELLKEDHHPREGVRVDALQGGVVERGGPVRGVGEGPHC